jgi:hypothetical protein
VTDLGCLYRIFDPTRAIDADDACYVDWQSELGLPDVKRRLQDAIQMSSDRFVCCLFSGHRGSGKTTELAQVRHRLANPLNGNPYLVSILSADAALELDDVSPIDLIVAIARQLIIDLQDQEITIASGRRLHSILEAAREILGRVGVTISANALGLVDLSIALKQQGYSVRSDLRHMLEGRIQTLFDAINGEILPTAQNLLNRRGYAGAVVIVDQLDRMPVERYGPVFWDGRMKLEALRCHTVYTLPIDYAYSRAVAALETEYGEIVSLPLLPVTAESRSLRDSAFASARAIVANRLHRCQTTEEDTFEAGLLNELIHLSGGNVRNLLFLVRTLIEHTPVVQSSRVAVFDADTARVVIRQLAGRYLDALDGQERAVLQFVHRTRRRPDDNVERAVFSQLQRDQYILTYQVGDDLWYDWYPLLERTSLDGGRAEFDTAPGR